MTDQFDLEQGIMECWNVTSDLDVLLEELMENDSFTTDQAANFVLGLSTIYGAKFDKLFRKFEDFLKEYYKMRKVYEDSLDEVDHLSEEIEALREQAYLVEEANMILASDQVEMPEIVSLDQLFDEEEKQLELLDENDSLVDFPYMGYVEEENSLV